MAVTFVVFALYGVFAAAMRRHVICAPARRDLDAPHLRRGLRPARGPPRSARALGMSLDYLTRPPPRPGTRGVRPGGPDDAGLRFGHAARDPQNLLWVMPAKGVPLIPDFSPSPARTPAAGRDPGRPQDLRRAAACTDVARSRAITAQNTVGVDGRFDAAVDLVAAQIRAVLTDIGVDAVKTGMLAAPRSSAWSRPGSASTGSRGCGRPGDGRHEWRGPARAGRRGHAAHAAAAARDGGNAQPRGGARARADAQRRRRAAGAGRAGAGPVHGRRDGRRRRRRGLVRRRHRPGASSSASASPARPTTAPAARTPPRWPRSSLAG